MQRDLEIGIKLKKKFELNGTFGYRDPVSPETNNWFSRRHYLTYHINDEVSVRAGRFYPAFGINIPEHTSVIRRGLGWDQGMESYNLEVAVLGEKHNIYLTAIAGRPDLNQLYREKGTALSYAYQINDTSKVGASYYYGESDPITHHYVGPFAILGFTESFYLLSQFDMMRSFPYTSTEAQYGYLDYQKLGYEIFQGFHIFLTQEFLQSDIKNNITRSDIYGAGIQFFPRPHFEFQVYLQKKITALDTSNPTDILGLYIHFYL